ncbi:E3 ubiquitin-protein ligase FANCL [Nannospalax galili]|uniref:E3 ubiquitin-protein ligase FANCL n=1 Tax=Nannospalax galili TaxID=1026970 RepID=UPI0004ED5919|nr:E3 ubiquitin-protein ligase FANCL [Nannospalax galili]
MFEKHSGLAEVNGQRLPDGPGVGGCASSTSLTTMSHTVSASFKTDCPSQAFPTAEAEQTWSHYGFACARTPAVSSLASIQSQFLAALESLKAFWDVMDEIDQKTWVLEPEKPTRSATTRRIALGNNASINVEVDPRHPTMLPELCFLGADHGEIHLKDPENSLLQNLKDVLEIDFPARTILEKYDFNMDCGICYAYQLDGSTPDQVCNNSLCAQPFHQICLYEPITLKMSGRKA